MNYDLIDFILFNVPLENCHSYVHVTPMLARGCKFQDLFLGREAS
jgi:hypothetical protein